MDIGSRIKQARLMSGLSQEDLGKRCGVKKQTIYKYESGVITNIPIDKIEMIANATNVSTAYLMGWDKPSQKEIESEDHKLLALFHLLNDEGKEKAIDYLDDLVQSEKYKKTDSFVMGQEA